MKMLMTFMVLLVTGSAFAQTSPSANNVIGKSFVSKTAIAVNRYDPLTGDSADETEFLLNSGTRFSISDVKDNGYILTVWNFKDPRGIKAKFYQSLREGGSSVRAVKGVIARTAKSKKIDTAKMILDQTQNSKEQIFRVKKSDLGIYSESIPTEYEELAFLDSWANSMQFFISLKDFNDKCEPIYPKQGSFTFGFLTLPIKARLGVNKAPFSFEEKINFGISFGGKWQRASTTYQAHNLLGGISIATVKVDNDLSASALSFSGGYMFQYDKFQVGAFIGLDYIAESQTVAWAYQGKPWIGFAIGISLFGESKTAAPSTQSQ